MFGFDLEASVVGGDARLGAYKSEMRKLVTRKKALYRFYDFKRSAASNGTSHGRRCSTGGGGDERGWKSFLPSDAGRVFRDGETRFFATPPKAVHGEFIWHSGRRTFRR